MRKLVLLLALALFHAQTDLLALDQPSIDKGQPLRLLCLGDSITAGYS